MKLATTNKYKYLGRMPKDNMSLNGQITETEYKVEAAYQATTVGANDRSYKNI